MKTNKIFLTCLMLMMLGAKAFSQRLPDGVKFNFETMFPMQAIQTSYADTFNSYYIVFKENTANMIARFSKEGYWHFTGVKLKSKEIPPALLSFITENYLKDKKTIYTVYQTETPFRKDLYYVETLTGKIRSHYLFNAEGVLYGY